MPTILLKNGSSAHVTIRNAEPNDINALMRLNQKWQRSKLEDLKNGFVGAGFSRETFTELINRRQVIVTDFQSQIVGYYLLNNFSKEGIIGLHEDFVHMLKQKGKIAKDANICVGGQVVVDTEFMGSGIRALMLHNLVANMQGKCDFLFATIAKDNPRSFTANIRDGWTVVDEDDSLFFVVYQL